jgi:seryl-tRNA synthetase
VSTKPRVKSDFEAIVELQISLRRFDTLPWYNLIFVPHSTQFPMIDIQLLRKDIASVADRLAQRKFILDSAGFNALEAERKSIQTRTEELQAQRNSLSKQIGILKGKGEDTTAVMNQVAGLGDELKASADQLDIVQAKLAEFMQSIPNLPHESVPAGSDVHHASLILK